MQRTLLALTFLLCFTAAAKADGLVLTISNPNGAVTYANPSITFFGTISNTSSQPINIGSPGFDDLSQRDPFSYQVSFDNQIGPIGISYGPFSFYNELIPTQLAAMSTTGEIRLFTVNVPLDNDNPAYILTGTFTVFSYASGTVGPVSGTIVPFRISVPKGTSVPEPATMVLFSIGVAGIASVLKRRRAVSRTN